MFATALSNHFGLSARAASLLSSTAFLTLTLTIGLTGCSSLGTDKLVTVVSPYRMEVVQGNFVSKEQVAALKPGLTRNQVRDILGTPLTVSIFHGNRWDYVFTLKRQGIESQARRLSVFFKSDVLERFEGDEMPSEAEFVAKLESSRQLGKIPVLEVAPDSLKKFAPVNPPRANAAAAAPANTSYPPLENPSR